MIVEARDGETIDDVIKRVQDEALAVEREDLIRQHGLEKAEEILLNRALGEMTYEPLEGECP